MDEWGQIAFLEKEEGMEEEGGKLEEGWNGEGGGGKLEGGWNGEGGGGKLEGGDKEMKATRMGQIGSEAFGVEIHG